MKLVYNPNFGYEGIVLKRLVEIGNLPLTLVALNADPDGTFPKGRPDPFIPENRVELVDKVKEEKADLGVAWDADADRVFFCTNNGVFLSPYYLNTLLIEKLLKKNPRAKVIYEPRYQWATVDTIIKNGGTPLLERVGHSFIKARMRKENAVFAGESSGHTYFRDFWCADSGIIPLLLVLEIISSEGKNLYELLLPLFDKYFISEETNFKTNNGVEIIEKAKKKYSDAKISELDGVSCEYLEWRFVMRLSNTEPLLRLNVEAKKKELLTMKFEELTTFINQNIK